MVGQVLGCDEGVAEKVVQVPMVDFVFKIGLELGELPIITDKTARIEFHCLQLDQNRIIVAVKTGAGMSFNKANKLM